VIFPELHRFFGLAPVEALSRARFPFDLDEAVRALLDERGREPAPPLPARLPFHYHRIPGRLRVAIARLLERARPRAPAAPRPPVEEIRTLFLRAVEAATGRPPEPRPFWPDGARYAVALTHDVDTAAGQALVPFIRAVEAEAGVASTFFFVTNGYRLDPGLLRGLQAEGCEVGAHGYDHDGRDAFVAAPEMDRRLDAAAARFADVGPVGFRSPCLGRSPALLAALGRRFAYDSSVPTRGDDGRSGCATVFPYEAAGGTLELPVTLPMDADLVFAGASPAAAVEAWVDALAGIRAAGGLGVLVTHPEPHFSGNPAWLDAYRALLGRVRADREAWVTTPGAVARWWRRRDAAVSPLASREG